MRLELPLCSGGVAAGGDRTRAKLVRAERGGRDVRFVIVKYFRTCGSSKSGTSRFLPFVAMMEAADPGQRDDLRALIRSRLDGSRMRAIRV